MQRDLLLLREMRDAAVAIRDLVGGRSADIDVETLVATSIDDPPELISRLQRIIDSHATDSSPAAE